MSFKRTDLVATGLLVLILVSTFFVGNESTINTTLVRNFPQSKVGLQESLFAIETVNPTPVRLNYSFTANTTVSLYVQTRSQFENSESDAEPSEYLAVFTGDSGSLGYETEDVSKRHVITVYSEERFLLTELILESEYTSIVEPGPSLALSLIQLLVLIAIGIQGFTLIQSREN